MSHGHEIHIHQENYKFSGKAKTLSLSLLVIGIVLTIAGIFMVKSEDSHASHSSHHAEAAHSEGTAKHSEHAAPTAATQADAHGHEAAATADVHSSDFNIHGVDTKHNNEQLHPVTAEHAKPWYTRVYLNLMLNGYFLLMISVCGLFFFALQYIANAGWATVLLRIPMAMSTIMPIGAAIILAVFLADGPNIYHWVHYEHQHLVKGDIGFDKILDNKSWFLNSNLALGFIICIPVVWILFGYKLRGMSYREDSEGGLAFFKKSIRYSAAFVFLFAFTLSILSWVIVMSIDAHWYSTIFSIYNWATAWVSCIAIITLIVLYLKRNGYLAIVTDEHIHDLGKFMFAFTIFWTYLWTAQFLLIWYANIPEESVYYYHRWQGFFKISWFANLGMNFIIPFLTLMTRNNKRNPKVLTFVAIVILIGHWNDIWLMLMPGALDTQAGIGLLEIGMTMAFAGGFIYWVFTALGKKGLIAVKHPYIEESAHHDVGV
jgi:hypothetical protein